MKYTSEEIGLNSHSPTDPINAIEPFLAEYFLVCSADSMELNRGTWSFSLDSIDGQTSLEAHDTEVGDLNRLTLLAAVRGLEAIDGSSDVTLLSQNRYLIRSLTDSLPRWRANQFAWEHFGRRIDVQNADLWRRVDHALSIHRVEACLVSARLVSRDGIDISHANASVFGESRTANQRDPMARSSSAGGRVNAIGNNMGGIQWRMDGAHAAINAPAASSHDKRTDQFSRGRFRDLIRGKNRQSNPTQSVLESA